MSNRVRIKTKRSTAGKVLRVLAAVLVAGNVFFNLALPTKAQAATAPGLVQNFVAPTTEDQIALSWAVPLDDGDSAITGYMARIRLSGETTWSSMVMQSNQLQITFDGLIVGEQYDVAVAATNAIGTGLDSEILNITVGSVPDVVEDLVFVDNGDSVLRATWNPPTNTGSGAITSYDFAYSLTGAETWDEYSVGAPSAMIIGLVPELYDIRVRAHNAAGAGEWTYLRNQYLGEVDYAIDTCEELQAMTHDLAGDYTLQGDIDCSGIANFVPIGMSVGSFSGSFNGNGHSINNLTINRPAVSAGLFQILSSTEVSNFTMHNATITGAGAAGTVASTLAGGSVTNVQVTGSAVAAVYDSYPDNTYAGGIIGYVLGTNPANYNVSGSSFAGTVSGVQNLRTPGIMAKNGLAIRTNGRQKAPTATMSANE